MSLISDFKKAKNLIKKGIKRRNSNRKALALLNNDNFNENYRAQIAVYFADSSINMYQLRQWYDVFLELNDRVNFIFLLRSPEAVLSVMQEINIPLAYLPKVQNIEKYIAENNLKIVFYVNQNTRNFQMMRYAKMWHVFINHGESDKSYMSTNQYKTYDYAFIAGEAAENRLQRALWNYNIQEKTRKIGRPQVDYYADETPFTPDDRKVVLYAPTWEGDRPAASYGSVLSHGYDIVSSILSDSNYRLVFRPHPRTGAVDSETKKSFDKIISLINEANMKDSSANHIYDQNSPLGWQLKIADFMVTDISAMIYDRLAVAKPIIVTMPSVPDAQIDDTGFLSDCYWLHDYDAKNILNILNNFTNDETLISNLQKWSRYYFGDNSTQSYKDKFFAATDELLALWNEFDSNEISK